MLKFRTKKKSKIPKYSIIIWLLSLVIMISIQFWPKNQALIYEFAVRPVKFWELLQSSNIFIFELFSSLFIHANWQHWLGNMVAFLMIAPALEKRMGGLWFLIVFFSSGFFGNLYSIFQLADSALYLLGASGAVSGLLGAWLMLYPKHQINVVIPIGLYMQKARIPITIVLFIWLVLQFLFQYLGSINHPVVWGAHIVGFISGFVISLIYRISH